MSNSKVVSAVGAATNSRAASSLMEKAMGKAVMDCLADGITDPAIVLERKAAYRAQVKADLALLAAKQIALGELEAKYAHDPAAHIPKAEAE